MFSKHSLQEKSKKILLWARILRNDEFIIYEEFRCKIKYLIVKSTKYRLKRGSLKNQQMTTEANQTSANRKLALYLSISEIIGRFYENLKGSVRIDIWINKKLSEDFLSENFKGSVDWDCISYSQKFRKLIREFKGSH